MMVPFDGVNQAVIDAPTQERMLIAALDITTDMLIGVRIPRRGYSFADGMDVRTGQLDTGLFFSCFQRNFARDSLNEHIKHNGSRIFAIPPGVQTGGYWGQRLQDG
jgi:deferrochelatase/peroxidase EfeB